MAFAIVFFNVEEALKTYSTTIRAHNEFHENLQVHLLTNLQSKINLKYWIH